MSCAKNNQISNTALVPIFVLFSIVKFTANTKVIRSKYTFKSLNYIIITIYFILDKIPLYINVMSLYCLNIGYGLTLVDCVPFLKKVLIEKIFQMVTILKVKSRKTFKYKLYIFVSIFLYFFSINIKNSYIYAFIHGEFKLVKGLKVNLLVGNDILVMKRVIISFTNKIIMISSCHVTISIIARPKNYAVQKKVLIDKSFNDLPEFETLI